MRNMTSLAAATAKPVAAVDWSAPASAGRLRRELRAGGMVFRREMLHFRRSRARTIVVLLQPLMFLFVLGVGLSKILEGVGPAGHGYLIFLFPGVLIMALQTPAISAGASIASDRESGFMREMLVAPVRPITLLISKCVGGACVATIQGCVVLACAGAIGVPYHPLLMVILAVEMAFSAFAITVLGAMIAVSIRSPQIFNTVLTFTVTPLLFMSGVMFPISAMPAWVSTASLFDPLTYLVDMMRHAMAGRMRSVPSPTLATHVTWGAWTLPSGVELAVMAVFVVAALGYAGRRLSRIE